MSATQCVDDVVPRVLIEPEREEYPATPKRQMLQHENEISGGHIAVHDIVRRFPLGVMPMRR
jgi:hypothetical protein